MSTIAVDTRPARKGLNWNRLLRRQGWTTAVFVLLAVMVAWKGSQLPNFDDFARQTITTSALAAAYLAAAQAIVVISGGIDLAAGAMLVLTNCVSAYYMNGQNYVTCLLIAAAVIIGAMALNGLTGWIITVSRVPDIVVTLATSFIWSGLALFIITSPGGGTAPEFHQLFNGRGDEWWPSLIVLAVPVIAIWAPLKRRRTGIALYAVGSNRDASFLSGVNIKRTRIFAYMLGGVFAALAGLATTAITQGGDYRFSIGSNATLNSVAAAVLGGVALTGGVGGIAGPIAAAFCLSLIPSLLRGQTYFGIDIDPNYAQVVQGVIIILVVLGGTLLQRRRTAT